MKSTMLCTRCSGMIVAAILAFGSMTAQATVMTGQWDNTTFGSSGPVTIDFTLAPPNYDVTIDLDGLVFGSFDPDPVHTAGTLEGDGSVILNVPNIPNLGDLTGTISNTGQIDVLFSNIPDPFIVNMTATGIFDGTSVHLDYRVQFVSTVPPEQQQEGFDFALGVLNAEVPEPATLVLLSSMAVLAIRRKR